MTKHSNGWNVPSTVTRAARPSPAALPNPTGVRSVAIIVTHEDERLDFAMTFTPDEILSDPGVVCTVEPRWDAKPKVHFELDAIPKGPGPWH